MEADPLSVSRDGQRLRFDVFKEPRTDLRSSSRSAPPGWEESSGRASAISSDDDDDDNDERELD